MIPRDPGPVGETPALLVVDPQHDFLDPDGAVPCPATSVAGGPDEVVENLRRVIAAAREADVPIVYSKEQHRPDFADSGAETLSPESMAHTVAGTTGETLVDGLGVDLDDLPPAEYLVTKRRYNLFFRTDLAHLLDTYGVDTVVVTGVTTNVCVHYTAQGALERDYLYRVVEECTAAPTETVHEAALALSDYLLPGGVQGVEAVLDGFAAYEGNPVVERVKETGSVVP